MSNRGVEALASRIGATPAELQEALTALPEVFRLLVEGLREAAQTGAVKEMTGPLLGILRELSPEDRDAVTALLLMSGNASGTGLRLASVPTDEIVRAMWGSDPACTSFEEIVAAHEEETKLDGYEPSDPTQLSELREYAESVRAVFLRAIFTEGRTPTPDVAANAVHRAAEKLGLVYLTDPAARAAREELFAAMGAFFASEGVTGPIAHSQRLTDAIANLRTLPARPEPAAARTAVDRFLAAWDADHADPPDPDKPAPEAGGVR